jgi:hypothetical protein
MRVISGTIAAGPSIPSVDRQGWPVELLAYRNRDVMSPSELAATYRLYAAHCVEIALDYTPLSKEKPSV